MPPQGSNTFAWNTRVPPGRTPFDHARRPSSLVARGTPSMARCAAVPTGQRSGGADGTVSPNLPVENRPPSRPRRGAASLSQRCNVGSNRARVCASVNPAPVCSLLPRGAHQQFGQDTASIPVNGRNRSVRHARIRCWVLECSLIWQTCVHRHHEFGHGPKLSGGLGSTAP